MDFEGNSNDSLTRAYMGDSAKKMTKTGKIITGVLLVISKLISWYGLICLAIAPSFVSGIYTWPIWMSMMWSLLVFVGKFIAMIKDYAPTSDYSNDNKVDSSAKARLRRFMNKTRITIRVYRSTFTIFISFAVIFSVAFPLATANTCVNFFNTGYGFKYYDMGVSTTLTRYFQLDTICPEGTICHTYTTLPEDSSTAIFLNAHAGIDLTKIDFKYDTWANWDNNKFLTHNLTTTGFPYEIETRGDR
mmetsp:Transcript_12896/g.11017  ORF Transcript_12896/g.11017 Transcript_12896/m.11017 type:complete len:246 (-) Transcript_12896:1219-1956(-)